MSGASAALKVENPPLDHPVLSLSPPIHLFCPLSLASVPSLAFFSALDLNSGLRGDSFAAVASIVPCSL